MKKEFGIQVVCFDGNPQKEIRRILLLNGKKLTVSLEEAISRGYTVKEQDDVDVPNTISGCLRLIGLEDTELLYVVVDGNKNPVNPNDQSSYSLDSNVSDNKIIIVVSKGFTEEENNFLKDDHMDVLSEKFEEDENAAYYFYFKSSFYNKYIELEE